MRSSFHDHRIQLKTGTELTGESLLIALNMEQAEVLTLYLRRRKRQLGEANRYARFAREKLSERGSKSVDMVYHHSTNRDTPHEVSDHDADERNQLSYRGVTKMSDVSNSSESFSTEQDSDISFDSSIEDLVPGTDEGANLGGGVSTSLAVVLYNDPFAQHRVS